MEKVKMDAKHEVAIMERAIETYGKESQILKTIEEMSELTKALLKYSFEDTGIYWAAVREEMADVFVMLSQMELIFGDVTDIEIEKLERLERRLDSVVQMRDMRDQV